MGETKHLISKVKKRIFCPKTTKFGPKLAFLVDLGQTMQAFSVPCCGSVGGCGARAASRKTPIYFIFLWLSRSAERQYIKVQQDQRSSLNVARCRLIAIVGHTFKTSFLMAVLF